MSKTVKNLNLLTLGQRVKIAEGDIYGTINGVAIYLSGQITYSVIYWHESERKTVWVEESEIELAAKDDMPTRINFFHKKADFHE